jgi:hypothetical protein
VSDYRSACRPHILRAPPTGTQLESIPVSSLLGPCGLGASLGRHIEYSDVTVASTTKIEVEVVWTDVVDWERSEIFLAAVICGN